MLTSYWSDLQIMKKDDIKVGHLYAGHKDGVWYRIKVKQFVSDDLVSGDA